MSNQKGYKQTIYEFSSLKERLRTTKKEIEKFQLMLNDEIKTNQNPFGSTYGNQLKQIIEILLEIEKNLNNEIPLLEIIIYYEMKKEKNLQKEGE
jgi:glycerophosphoryl diester phosphodiesterase